MGRQLRKKNKCSAMGLHSKSCLNPIGPSVCFSNFVTSARGDLNSICIVCKSRNTIYWRMFSPKPHPMKKPLSSLMEIRFSEWTNGSFEKVCPPAFTAHKSKALGSENRYRCSRLFTTSIVGLDATFNPLLSPNARHSWSLSFGQTPTLACALLSYWLLVGKLGCG